VNPARDKAFYFFFQKIEGGQNPGSNTKLHGLRIGSQSFRVWSILKLLILQEMLLLKL
jgi:hypothetical protein